MSTPTFLLIEASQNPDNQNAHQSYLSKAPEIVKKYGGQPIATYAVDDALDSAPKPSAIVVMSFPDRDSIDNLFSDPDYQKLIPLRNQAFDKIRYYVCNEKI